MGQRSFIQPTLKQLSDDGVQVDVVERFIRTGHGPSPAGFRRDWHGFADLIGFDRQYLYAVQVCRSQDMDEHARKITNSSIARSLVTVPQLVPRILLYGWKDVNLRGGRTKQVPHVRIIGLSDFLDMPHPPPLPS